MLKELIIWSNRKVVARRKTVPLVTKAFKRTKTLSVGNLMKTEKTNFQCKRSYEDYTHCALLLNLVLQCSHKLTISSSSAHFKSVGSQCTQNTVQSHPGILWLFSEQGGKYPVALPLVHIIAANRITKKFCRHPTTKREKKNCKGMAKEDGRTPTMSYKQTD